MFFHQHCLHQPFFGHGDEREEYNIRRRAMPSVRACMKGLLLSLPCLFAAHSILTDGSVQNEMLTNQSART